MDASLTQLLTQLGVVSHADAVVSNNNTGQRRNDLLVQVLNKSLLGFQNLCTYRLVSVSGFFVMYRKKPLPVAGKGLESIAFKRTFLGRWDILPLCLAAPAVSKTA